jgi:hypothetical protein
MGDPRFLPGFVLVGLVAAVTFASLLAIGLSRSGAGRSGLVAGGLPLSLLAPVLAAAYASSKLIGLFSGMAQAQPGAARLLVDAFVSLWLLQRAAWGAFAASCLVGLVLGLARSSGSASAPSCSVRRGLVLLLLPALALAVASGTARPLAKALRVSNAVVCSDTDDPASQDRADAALEEEGLPRRGAGSIAATSRFIGAALATGAFGGAVAFVVLLGLALPGFILAWRVRFGAPFTAAATALWLLAGAGAAAVCAGVVDPLRLP